MKAKTKKGGLVVALVLALAAGGAGGAYYYHGAAVKQAAPAGETLTITPGDLVETAAASGKIEPHVQVEVKSRTSGEIVELLAKEGDVVEQGQLLLRLDPTDAERNLADAKVALERVRADLAAAQAQLVVTDLEKKNSAVSEELAKKSLEAGLGTPDAVRTSEHAARVASANHTLRAAQLAASRTQLRTAELAVQDAELRLKETKIFAPMSGTVLDVPVEKGTIIASALTNVSGGTTVMTIADLSDLRIIAQIDEAQVGKVLVGQKADIRVDAYPERVFRGEVGRVSPLGVENASVVTFDVEIVVKDEQIALLRSGMSADVEITTSKHEGVLLVPLAAIQSSGPARFVTLASGERRKIKTGASDGAQLVVLEGLAAGDVILASAPVSAPAGAPGGPGQSGQRSSSGNVMRSMGGGMGRPPGGR